MVFSIGSKEALSEHNLQIYQFRKLNRAFLAGVHGILKEDERLCSQSVRTSLLLEYLPYSLMDFYNRLEYREGMVVLKAVFAGYRIMSYLFGPLLSAEDMIYFTEGGVPKVWINTQLNRN